jgi:hypothetical protein
MQPAVTLSFFIGMSSESFEIDWWLMMGQSLLLTIKANLPKEHIDCCRACMAKFKQVSAANKTHGFKGIAATMVLSDRVIDDASR